MANALIGKTITKMKIADDRQALLFITPDGAIQAKVDGDCCSHSWVENVELPVNGFPAIVISAEDIPMPDLGNGDAECRQYYGYKLTTDKGDIIIDYRNDSNGYYGGSIWFPDSDPEAYNRYYGGVFDQNVSAEKWQDIAA
jgi:hypothetical protein